MLTPRLNRIGLTCLALVLCGGIVSCSDGGDSSPASTDTSVSSTVEAEQQITQVALVEPLGWAFQARNRDLFAEHRPRTIECREGEGWLVEDGEVEIRTDQCNYLSLAQESLLNLPAGTSLELALSHGDLVYRDQASAHVALSIGGVTVWEKEIDIPGEGAVYREDITLDFEVKQRDPIELHLHNHGSNAWTFHALDAVIVGEFDPDAYCPSYDSTFEAIQATVFEPYDCTNSQCHSSTIAAGGLDLSPEVAYANLVDTPGLGSDLLRVAPRYPSESLLYRKLAAKTKPGSYDIPGSPMPAAGEAISAGQLEAIRLWIEAGAPETGSVGDTLGRGEDEIERLLGVCLPEAEAVNVIPLEPPPVDKGIQFHMPAHPVLAESEREICFAVYEDFRDQVPEQYLSEDREYIYVHGEDVREDPYTHHYDVIYSGVPVEQIHDPSYGSWTCAGGEREGDSCEPTDTLSCGPGGRCRSEIRDSIACRGFGPGAGGIGVSDGINLLSVSGGPDSAGFYEKIPSHGIYYWNSHAFNLTTEDAMHNVWQNLYFADDLRYEAQQIAFSAHIWAGAGTKPFSRKEVCREYRLNQGDAVLEVTSHTHKRGELFTVALKGQEDDPFYVTRDYDEPLVMKFDPPWEFNDPDPDTRTLVYCATFNNGLNPDGSYNLDTVTRQSLKPTRSRCRPTACVAGNIGAPCAGEEDDASCDSSPGAGDGFCDACPISAGVTSDDEMFVLSLTKTANFAELVSGGQP